MREVVVEFDGQDMFIMSGSRLHRIYPAQPGTYWADVEGRDGVDTRVMLVDDFGNLVDGFHGARQRAHFRQVLH